MQLVEKRLRGFFNDAVLFLDQINNRVVDPRSLKFKRNVHGKPEVSFHLLFNFLKLIFSSYTTCFHGVVRVGK